MFRPSLLPAGTLALLPVGTAALLVAALLFAVSWVPVPYVTLTPGPTVDTLGEFEGSKVITVTGAPTYPSEGELRFTTVAVYGSQSLGDSVVAWFDRQEAVVPRETIYPPGQTQEESDAANEQVFTESESSATAAALRYLGYPTEVVVVEVREDGPSAGVLAAGDVLTSVDSVPVDSSAEVVEAVGSVPAGTAVDVGYVRQGRAATASVVTEPATDGSGRSVIGVVITEQAEGSVSVEITAKDVGGPSAGLMLSLGIVDELTPEDLTGGRTVAGTGTITADGDVGAIGGVAQKVVAAFDSGAREFLVPYDNCAEAQRNAPDGLQLVPVRTLSEAVDILRPADGAGLATAPGCPAG